MDLPRIGPLSGPNVSNALCVSLIVGSHPPSQDLVISSFVMDLMSLAPTAVDLLPCLQVPNVPLIAALLSTNNGVSVVIGSILFLSNNGEHEFIVRHIFDYLFSCSFGFQLQE